MAPESHPSHLGLACALATALTWGVVGVLVRLLPSLDPLQIVGGRLGSALLAALPALVVGAYRAEVARALLAVSGVALTLVPSFRGLAAGHAAGGAARLAGDALALAAAAASALYAMTFRSAERRGAAPSPFGVAVLTFALGTGALAVRAALQGEPFVPLARLDVAGAARLVVLGVVSTLVPTLTFAAAARRLPPVLTSAAQLLVPLVAALAAAVALRELPSPWLLPGAALVLVGLTRLLTTRRVEAAPVE